MQKRLCRSTASLGFYTQCRPPFTHQEGKQPGDEGLSTCGFYRPGEVREHTLPWAHCIVQWESLGSPVL